MLKPSSPITWRVGTAAAGFLLAVALVPGCGSDAVDSTSETETESGTGSGSTSGSTSAASTSATSAATDSGTTGSTGDGDTSTGGGSGTAGVCGEGGPCPNVVVLGYWPPTNEMLRQWSQSPAQNPGGWQGANWNGLGYDVYSFFPEFPPDGDPSNDDIGSEGSVGSPDSDLRVDYQDTSEDFWRIMDEYAPVILVTTSRGGDTGWEVEAVEGGHEHPMNPNLGPERDWISDQHGAETYPTMDSTDARSWDAISTYRKGNTLPSQLPMTEIVDAVSALGLAGVSVAIDQDGTSGRYLSGFLGLHGLYYNAQNRDNLAAGHIHVGSAVTNDDARQMIETTLTVVLEAAAPP